MIDTDHVERSERQLAVVKWLAAQGLREDVSAAELADLHTLFAPHKGFGILWSLIAFERAKDLEELKNANFSTESGRARGSVLQGQIRAVDRLYETLLSIADPGSNAATTAGEGQEIER